MGELPAMRRQDKEIRDPALLHQILGDAVVCRVAMCDGDRPYVIPLSFVLDGDALFIHSAAHGRKLAILARNPRVCFEVTVDVAVVPAARACDVTLRYRSVIGEGRAAFLEDPAAKVRALEAIAARYAAGAPVSAAEAARVAIVEIAVDSLSCKASPPPRR